MTESAPSEEAIENYDAEGVGSAAFVLGGPAVGGIIGLYLFDDADDGAVTYLRNCSWSRPAPAGYYAAIYDTGIEDVGPQA